jgi:pimeloyl-ACP methyl ester carboxylesterase
MADGAPVQPASEAREIRAVTRIEGVRTVEDTEVVGDAFPLDEGGLAPPLDAGRRQVGRGRTVATEEAGLRKLAVRWFLRSLPPWGSVWALRCMAHAQGPGEHGLAADQVREVMRRSMTAKRVPYPVLGCYVLRHVQRVIGASLDDIAPLSTLAHVRCPVLLVHGRSDSAVPVIDAQRLRRG